MNENKWQRNTFFQGTQTPLSYWMDEQGQFDKPRWDIFIGTPDGVPTENHTYNVFGGLVCAVVWMFIKDLD